LEKNVNVVEKCLRIGQVIGVVVSVLEIKLMRFAQVRFESYKIRSGLVNKPIC